MLEEEEALDPAFRDIRERLACTLIAIDLADAMRWLRFTHAPETEHDQQASPNAALYCGKALGAALAKIVRLELESECRPRAMQLFQAAELVAHGAFACAHHKLLSKVQRLESRVAELEQPIALPS